MENPDALTFTGTLDDCVERAPFGTEPASKRETALETLLRHALFGRPMLLHSGFAFHNVEFQQIIKRYPEVVENLISLGRLKILSETGDIFQDELNKRGRGVATAIEAGPPSENEACKLLEKWLNAASRNKASAIIEAGATSYERASDQRSALMKQAVEMASSPAGLGLDITPSAFEDFRRKFLEWLPKESPRSAWQRAIREEICSSESFRDNKAARQLMSIANEIFHYSTVGSLPPQAGEVYIETSFSPALRGYIPYENHDLSDRDEPKAREFADIRVPVNSIVSNQAEFFQKLFSEDDLGQARRKYLTDQSDQHEVANYERRIYEALGYKLSRREIEEKYDERVAPAVSLGVAAAGLILSKTWRDPDGSPEKLHRRSFIKWSAIAAFASAGAWAGKEYIKNIASDAATDVASEILYQFDKDRLLHAYFGDVFGIGTVFDTTSRDSNKITSKTHYFPPTIMTDLKPSRTH